MFLATVMGCRGLHMKLNIKKMTHLHFLAIWLSIKPKKL